MPNLVRGTVVARGVECPAVWRNGKVRYKSPSGKVLDAGYTIRNTFMELGVDREFNDSPAALREMPYDLGVVRGIVKYRGRVRPAIKLRSGEVFYARPMVHVIKHKAAPNGNVFSTFRPFNDNSDSQLQGVRQEG